MNAEVEQEKELLEKARQFYSTLCEKEVPHGTNKRDKFKNCYKGWHIFVYQDTDGEFTWTMTIEQHEEDIKKKLQNNRTSPLYRATIPSELVKLK